MVPRSTRAFSCSTDAVSSTDASLLVGKLVTSATAASTTSSRCACSSTPPSCSRRRRPSWPRGMWWSRCVLSHSLLIVLPVVHNRHKHPHRLRHRRPPGGRPRHAALASDDQTSRFSNLHVARVEQLRDGQVDHTNHVDDNGNVATAATTAPFAVDATDHRSPTSPARAASQRHEHDRDTIVDEFHAHSR